MNFNTIFKTGLIALIAGSLGYFVYADGNSDDATANVDLEIVESIQVTKDHDLNFGKITYSGSGSITIDESDGSVTVADDVSSFDDTDAREAEFTVEGEANATYTVTLPTDITIDDGNDNITVDNFKHSATEELGTSGEETFGVGAEANIDGSEDVGTYSGDFTVDVDYN